MGELTMDLAYIFVDPSSGGSSRMCKLSGVESSGLDQAELRDNNTTVSTLNLGVTSYVPGAARS